MRRLWFLPYWILYASAWSLLVAAALIGEAGMWCEDRAKENRQEQG